ncbi:MAG: T9SS type A sorting domain-containing protein [Bacteroidetes bacterium]|nr:T9SS type A sorting domain-containing protein [Bacteroidota bacterium]
MKFTRLFKLTLGAMSLILVLLFINIPKNKSASIHKKGGVEKEETDAMDALQFMNTSRAFPYADIPEGAYKNAFDFYQKNYLNVRYKTNKAPWKSIGPNNVGGRTLCITIDPKDTAVLWLGSASGGLWKSTTGGLGKNAWQYVSTGFPILGVSSIAIDPTNSKNMLIGTGETYSYGGSTNGLVYRPTRGTFGMGIYRTTDGGKTWSKSLDWSYQQNRCIWDIVINPKNSKMIYAATTEGVYKSTDGGTNWSSVLAEKMVMDLAIDKKDTNIVYACVGNVGTTTHGIYKTKNSGGAWAVLSNGIPKNSNTGRISISLYEKNNKVMMASVFNTYNTVGYYRSLDEGKTWKKTSSSDDIASYQGWYCKGLLMKADDSSQVLAGGVQLFYSSDFANSFSVYSYVVHSDIHDIISNPLDPDKIYCITDGGLFRTFTFNDQNYLDCNDGYITSQAYIGSVSRTDSTKMLIGLQDNNTYKADTGHYWFGVVGGDGCYNAIDNTDDVYQYAAYQYLNVYRSQNYGSNFSSQILSNNSSPTDTTPAAFLAPFVLCPSDPNFIYAGDKGIIVSQDRGDNWSTNGKARLDSGNYIMAIGVSHTSTDTLYCGTAPWPAYPHRCKIFRSFDGSKTMKDITHNLPNRYPRCICVSPFNNNEVYVAYSGFNTGHLFKTTDAGNNWVDVSTKLPNVPFHTVLPDPHHRNTIYAGCDFGIFMSTDTGNTWSLLQNGMPEICMVFDLQFSYSDTSLLAFTHGNGIYKRSMKENYFTGINTPKISPQNISVYPNPFSENVTVNLANMPHSKMVKITIYDFAGREFFHQDAMEEKQNEYVVNTHRLPAGTYIISVVSGNQKYTAKIVKYGR